ncbi:F-box protein At4g22280 isoform X1 [Nicotiana tabacum]|uniref:F-box protein At4g22280 isoform X1 n=1 Tax=Nicotiana tabacum TaxID=4097 RepID=A0A1S3X8F9_TOBAC|nr:F-box/LRR-repeat protein At3g59190 isoform X1 [Nicotiana tomentosiformis]XP_016436079.1 PREDICTED: F-box/LRR-repeat protein At3g59190-like isoform X1 [Nicotiana tabacum]XP_033512077.1 F-box/LRR-repeat protein At3g59190 isoform X1 [Nicotiana tomentosiformis]
MITRSRWHTINSFKRQNALEVHNIDNREDKISNLPDSILHHILSYLPTRDVLGTCILSTRWKNLWTCVENIDFDDSLLYSSGIFGYPVNVTCFMHFVQRILQLREESDIKKFRLSCRVCFSASHVCSWILAAIRHNVKELDLCLFVEEPFMLPQCVFSSKTLTSLKLEMNCVLELPASTFFPFLRTLHLCLVTFRDDSSTQRLFSGCPMLRELAILDCEWMNLKHVAISISTLKSLTIDDLPFFGSTDDLNGCEIKIDASSLSFLKYSGYLSNEIYLYNLSPSVYASIHIPILYEKRNEIAFRAVKLFRGLHKINAARISSRAIESLFIADIEKDRLPVFYNLMHLELSMELENHTIGPLKELLQCLPKLQSLHFSEGLAPCMRLCEDDWNLRYVPSCFLSSLKTVTYSNFHGNNTEISFLRNLVKNTIVLEKLNIMCSKRRFGDPKKQNEVKDQLQSLHRGSMSCAIKFM